MFKNPEKWFISNMLKVITDPLFVNVRPLAGRAIVIRL